MKLNLHSITAPQPPGLRRPVVLQLADIGKKLTSDRILTEKWHQMRVQK